MNEYYENGPEGMPRVERMTDSTIMAVLSQKNVPTIYVHSEQDYASLRLFAHAIAEETLARVPAWPAERTTYPVSQMTDATIREIFMANGFTIKEGQTDLKPYVYAAARAILAASAPQAQADYREIQCTKCGQYGLHFCNEMKAVEPIADLPDDEALSNLEFVKGYIQSQNESFATMMEELVKARAGIAASQPSKLPPPELTWLYTHCRAIGMDCKSYSGKWEEDIGLWTVNLTNEIKALRANQQAAEPVARKVVAWTAKDGDEWIVYDAESRTGQHIAKYQTESHGVDVFPIYEDCKP